MFPHGGAEAGGGGQGGDGSEEQLEGAAAAGGNDEALSGFAAIVMGLARRGAALQSGYLYHYAFAMMIGVAVLVSWFLFFG